VNQELQRSNETVKQMEEKVDGLEKELMESLLIQEKLLLDFNIKKGLPVCPYCSSQDYFVLDTHINDKVHKNLYRKKYILTLIKKMKLVDIRKLKLFE
jgi:hypothetical protein